MADTTLYGCLPTRGSNGDFKTYEDVNVIIHSIYVILNTPIGTRPWQPTFGCNMKLRIFDLMTEDTLNSIRDDIRTALNTWEPRIRVNEVSVEQSADQVVGVNVAFTYNNRNYSTKIATAMKSTTIYDF